ncbi:MAG: autotransporter-associated beta strand repeat-containing protein [Tepidisphaeraceae bacterium]
MLLSCASVRAQTQLVFQGFETADSWTISAGSGNVSNATGSGDTPASQRILAGTNSWQVNNGTGTLDLASTSITGYTGITLTYRVTSTSTTTSNGSDNGDYVRSFVALNGAAFASNSAANSDIEITGNSNARWGYDATLTATTTAATNLQVASPQGGTSTNNYSTFVVNVPNGNSSLAFRIIARNNAAAEVWSVDSITLTGTIPTSATWDANGATAGTGGTGTWDTTNARFTNGDLIWNNSVNGSPTAVTFASTAGVVTLGTGISASALTFSADGYTIQSDTLTLTGSTPTISVTTAGHSATISSVLAGANSLTKTGAGKLILSGANSYSGVTSVSNGTLSVTGSLGSGGGLVSVTATTPDTAALAGTGTVSRSVTIGDRGLISPGTADFNMSSFNINAASTTQTFASGGTYRWEVNKLPAAGSAGTNWDTVNFNALTVTATSGGKFTIKIVSLNSGGTAAGALSGLSATFGTKYTWVIALTGGLSGFSADKFDLDFSSFSADQPGFWSLAASGNNLELTLTIPEPPTAMGAFVLSLAALLRRNRRGCRQCR